jgi:hypothetical protein
MAQTIKWFTIQVQLPARGARALLLAGAVFLAACSREPSIGDRILVEWEGQIYPAFVLERVSGTTLRVHYEGMDLSWDETVHQDRLRGFAKPDSPKPEPPAKVRARLRKGAPETQYKVGDTLSVQWQGNVYRAEVRDVFPNGRLRVHYIGYGSEWDETIEPSRVR